MCNSLIIKAVNSWFKFHHRNFIEIPFPFHCFKSAPYAFHFVKIFYFLEILSKNGWNQKPSNLKTIEVWKCSHRANKYLLIDHNRSTRTRWGISSKLAIKISERRHWPRLTLHISHGIVELQSAMLTLRRKIIVRNPCYKSPSTLKQSDIIALLSLFSILNIFHTLF